MRKHLIITILIFIIALAIRLIAIEKKTFIHHDEPLSFASSTLNNTLPNGSKFKFDWWRFDVDNYEYNLEDFRKSFFQSKSSIKSIKDDLILMRKGNIEIEHSNLYYSFLRIWNIGLDGTNIKECVKRACYLNILFFIIEFFFLYKLLNLIKPNDTKFMGLGLFFAFCNTAGISNTLLIREYALAEMFFVIATYTALVISKKGLLKPKSMLVYSLIFALTALSNNMLIVYDGILAIYLIIHSWKKKELLWQTLFMIAMAFGWIFLIYPVYFKHFFDNQYSEYINQNMKSFKFHSLDYYSFIFYKSIIFTILVGSIIFTKKIYKPLLKILLPALIWLLIIQWLIPYANIRFIFAALPIVSLIYTAFLYYFKTVYAVTISALFFLLTITPIYNKTFNYTKIDYLYGDAEKYSVNLLKNTTIPSKNYPVVVYNIKKRTWYYTYWYFTKLENKGKIIFTDKLPDKDFKYKKFFLMMYLPDHRNYYTKKYCKTKLAEMESWPDAGVYEVCFVEFD